MGGMGGGMRAMAGGSWQQDDSAAVVPSRAQYYSSGPLLQAGPDQGVIMYGGGPGMQGGDPYGRYMTGPAQSMSMMQASSGPVPKQSSADRYTAWSGLWRQKGSAYRVQAQQAPPVVMQAQPQPQLVWVEDPSPPAINYVQGPPTRVAPPARYVQQNQVYQATGPMYQQAPAGYGQTRTYYQ